MFDVAVIGAGVVGGFVARELTKYNLKVCILEKNSDVAMGATRANSAIVHGGFDAKEGTLKAKLNVRGSVMMEEVCRQLGVKYKRNGSLVVGFNDEDKATLEGLIVRGTTNGVQGLKLLNREEILAIEPNIGAEVTVALHAPTGAIVCPYELCMASIGNAMDNGAELKLDFKVDSIEKTAEGYKISAGGESVVAKYVVNCAGVYSDEIAALTGDNDFNITPRKGEYMLLDNECGRFTRRTIFHTPTKMGKGVLVSPTVDGNLLLGPTAVDITDKDDTSTTAEGFAAIFDKTGDNAEGVPFNKVITSFSGLRATGSTGDFIIKHRDSVITLGGIESPGLSSAPAIAEYVESMLKNEVGITLTEKKEYIKTRRSSHWFRDADAEEKNAAIKRDPAYGRIVCRCEAVTEGEIVEAIRTNPPARDLDSVKRRTRSGLGRCQGGFCTPTVVGILARELQIPFEDVTKSGGASVLNYERTKGR